MYCTGQNRNNVTAITTRSGDPLWRWEKIGPRGGTRYLYAERRSGDTAPTGWELWSETQSKAGGSASTATTHPTHGLFY